MSVINQMLHDLEGRRNRQADSGFIDSLSLRDVGVGRFKTGMLWTWPVLLTAAGAVLVLIWRLDGIEPPDSPRAQRSVAPVGENAVVDKSDLQAEAGVPANRVNGISWQSDGDNTLRLVLHLDNQPSSRTVTRSRLNNGEIQFILPDTRLAASLPLLDNDRRYFRYYRIGHRDGDVLLHILPLPDVSVQWEAADDERAWILTASSPERLSASVSPDPAKPTVAKAAPADPPVKSAPSQPSKPSTSAVKKPATARQNPEAGYQRALSFLSADRIRPAVHELERVINSNAAFHPARELLAGLYLQTGRDTEAFILLKDGVALAPENLAFARLYAEAMVRRGRLEQALNILSRSDPYAGGDAAFQALYAATAQRMGEHQVAIPRYMRALDMESENGAWWMGLAMSLEADGRLESAVGAYNAAMDTGALNSQLTDYVQSRLKGLESSR